MLISAFTFTKMSNYNNTTIVSGILKKCNFSTAHHKGTEAELASLWASPYKCQNDQEKSEIEALASWYT